MERVRPPAFLFRLFNPVVRWLAFQSRSLQRFVLVLHFRGRKSRRPFDLPVGYRIYKGDPVVLTSSPWFHNFRGGIDIEVTYFGRRQAALATLIEEPAAVASVYLATVEEHGIRKASRRLGVRINLDRAPTHEEWEEAFAAMRMSIVRLEGLEPRQ